jgi:hypothetical protein
MWTYNLLHLKYLEFLRKIMYCSNMITIGLTQFCFSGPDKRFRKAGDDGIDTERSH